MRVWTAVVFPPRRAVAGHARTSGSQKMKRLLPLSIVMGSMLLAGCEMTDRVSQTNDHRSLYERLVRAGKIERLVSEDEVRTATTDPPGPLPTSA